MKKFLLLLIALFGLQTLEAQILLSKPEASSELSEAVIDKKFDDNKQLCALVSLEITGLTLDQVQNMSLSSDSGSSVYPRPTTTADNLRFYISPAATYLEVGVPGYEKERIAFQTEFVGGRFYKMKLHARALETEISITSSNYKEARVYIDGDWVGVTPLTTRVKLYHPFTIRVEGDKSEEREVTVTEDSSKAFDFVDVIGSKMLTITVSHNAKIYLDEEFKGSAGADRPFNIYGVSYGLHQIKAEAIAFNDVQRRPIQVSDGSSTNINIQMQHKKTVTIKANTSRASVSVDGLNQGYSPLTTDLSYGRHDLVISAPSYRTLSTSINVTDKSDLFEYRLKTVRRRYVTHDLEPRPIGFTFGYVQKHWSFQGDGFKQRYGFWLDDEKSLNGMQLGFRVEPRLGWWFYIHTGLYYEYYYDKSNEQYDSGSYFLNYQEHNFYIPAQLEFKIPIADEIYFYLVGGVGFDIGLYAKVGYKEEGLDEAQLVTDDIYGNPDWADFKRCNISGEFGGGICIGKWKFGAQLSRGLLDVSLHPDSYSTKQNKFSAFISIMF